MKQKYTSEEFWEIYTDKKRDDRYTIAHEFFAYELPKDFIKNYDAIEVILRIKDYHDAENDFDKIEAFGKLIKENQPELYKTCSQYFDSSSVRYNCFCKKFDNAKEAFSNLQKDPVESIDEFCLCMNTLLFYKHNDFISSAITETYNVIDESNDIMELVSSELTDLQFYFLLEKVYDDFLETGEFKQALFKKNFEKIYKNNTLLEHLSDIEQGLLNDNINIDFYESNFLNDRKKTIDLLEVDFLKYMKKKNFSFALTHSILENFYYTQFIQFEKDERDEADRCEFEGIDFKWKKYSINEYFSIELDSYKKAVSRLSGNFFMNGRGEDGALLWGTVYLYDFLLENKLITQDVYDSFVNISRTLKGAFIAVNFNTLWEFNFIHSWQKPDSISNIEFTEEEKIFSKSFNIQDYKSENSIAYIQDELNKIGELSDFIKVPKEEKSYFEKLCHQETPYIEQETPYIAQEKTGRNSKCPCGSGKKYKKCCL